MLGSRYMQSTKNLPAIMKKIVDGAAPTKFTLAHLRSLGFKSSYDNSVIPVLKEIGFLADDGTPLDRYHAYRDTSRSKAVMAEALRETYSDLFLINENLTASDKAAIQGRFKSEHNVSDRVAKEQANTFLALLKLADLNADSQSTRHSIVETKASDNDDGETGKDDVAYSRMRVGDVGLRYNIEIHLPATKDVDVFNAIFKSLKEHIIEP